jgi:hypothetical protein
MCWFMVCLWPLMFKPWFLFFRLKLLEKKKSEMALKSRKVKIYSNGSLFLSISCRLFIILCVSISSSFRKYILRFVVNDVQQDGKLVPLPRCVFVRPVHESACPKTKLLKSVGNRDNVNDNLSVNSLQGNHWYYLRPPLLSQKGAA